MNSSSPLAEVRQQLLTLIPMTVHALKSFMFIQLAGFGRGALPAVLEKAEGGPYPVVGPSEIPLTGCPIPHTLTHEELEKFIDEAVKAALNAVNRAGADGVEM